MQAIEGAVIAAAGLGSRLGLGVPKSLLDLGGKTVLSRLIETLQDHIDRIHVVVGYREDLVIAHCAQHHPKVVLVRNPDFRNTNTAYSFALGARAFEGKCLFLDGDLVAMPDSIESFVTRSASSDVLIGLTDAKSENAVLVECENPPDTDGHCTVTGFSRDIDSTIEWANIVSAPAEIMKGAAGFVFERLREYLPAQGQLLELCEIDTGADLASAEAFVKRMGI